MRTLLVGAALGVILVSQVATAAPGAGEPHTLATRGQVTALAADGDHAALIVRLERPGLFVAGGRRVTFTPMRDVLHRLSG
jgi:hypothetical protein